VLSAHGETIRVKHTLRRLGVARAGRDVYDPYRTGGRTSGPQPFGGPTGAADPVTAGPMAGRTSIRYDLLRRATTGHDWLQPAATGRSQGRV
jgi:hypothetical protein